MPAGLKPGQKALVGAGRKKGTPNKNTLIIQQRIAEVCGPDWDPLVMLSEMAQLGTIPIYDPQTRLQVGVIPISSDLRQKCAKEVAEYIHPKRKAIELSNPNDNPLNLGLQITFVKPSTTHE